MIYLAEAAVGGGIWGPALAAVGVIVTAVLTTIGTLRTSQRAAAVQREQQREQRLDQRSDREYERVVAQRDEAEADLEQARTTADVLRRERDEVREELAGLRYRVWLAGHDPETIGRGPGIEPRPRI